MKYLYSWVPNNIVKYNKENVEMETMKSVKFVFTNEKKITQINRHFIYVT